MSLVQRRYWRPILLLLLVLDTTIATAENITRRVANSGNLVMEDIPPIPSELVQQLNRYQNVRSADFEAWSADSRSIYITTRFGDVSQLHKVSKPGGSRQQITFFDEPIGAVSRQPNGDLIAFTMDVGGSENAQIFILDPNSGRSKMISDGKSRNGVISWRRDGRALAYQSTRRNGTSKDIWLHKFNDDGSLQAQSELIFSAPDGSWWGTGEWTPDGRRMLVQQYVSVTDSRVHMLDIRTGKIQLLTGSAERPSVNYTISLDKNSKGHYFLTDTTGEFAQLAHQRFSDGLVTLVTGRIPWDVETGVLSPDRKRFAFSVNAGGNSEVYLLETDNNNYRKVSGLPLGTIGGIAFSPDSKKLALSLDTAKSPSDSYVIELTSNKLKHGPVTRWTLSEVGGLDTAQFVEPNKFSYPTFDKVGNKPRRIPAFIYKPRKAKRPVPVIISIHGGPESQYRPEFSSTIQLWVDQLGAAVIAPNVRGSAGYGGGYVSMDNGRKREDSVKDIGALLDWIAREPGLDENRVFVIGGSYGGYMVLASAVYYSDRLLGAVDIVGISNFVTFLKNTQDYRRDLRRAEYGDERDPEMYRFLQSISPNNMVDRINIPMLVVQGQNDPRVPVSEAEQIVKSLREKGNEVWYMNALNEGHGYRRKENRDIYQQAVMLFFQKHLSKP